MTVARWSVGRSAAWQGHWWSYKKRDRKFLVVFLLPPSFASRGGVGIENVLHSIRSRHCSILAVSPSFRIYSYGGIYASQIMQHRDLFYFVKYFSINLLFKDKR